MNLVKNFIEEISNNWWQALAAMTILSGLGTLLIPLTSNFGDFLVAMISTVNLGFMARSFYMLKKNQTPDPVPVQPDPDNS